MEEDKNQCLNVFNGPSVNGVAVVDAQALFGKLSPDVMLFTMLYSIAGLGIAIVNDFKSIEGDR
jgi:4-hydroxybenzoate polyprenyltransferase